MARTTSDAVKAILLRDYDTFDNPSLDPFINRAALIVNRIATCAENKGTPLSSEELEAIEAWLAAHFYCVSDKAYTSKTTLEASASFNGQTGMYLDATLYGQQAKLFDFSGCLSSILASQKQSASASWLGKPVRDQINYTDRGN